MVKCMHHHKASGLKDQKLASFVHDITVKKWVCCLDALAKMETCLYEHVKMIFAYIPLKSLLFAYIIYTTQTESQLKILIKN